MWCPRGSASKRKESRDLYASWLLSVPLSALPTIYPYALGKALELGTLFHFQPDGCWAQCDSVSHMEGSLVPRPKSAVSLGGSPNEKGIESSQVEQGPLKILLLDTSCHLSGNWEFVRDRHILTGPIRLINFSSFPCFTLICHEYVNKSPSKQCNGTSLRGTLSCHTGPPPSLCPLP